MAVCLFDDERSFGESGAPNLLQLAKYQLLLLQYVLYTLSQWGRE
jgi:hypothetical protein